MTILNAAYNAQDQIDVNYDDGSSKSIPVAEGNRDYRELANWIALDPFNNKVAPFFQSITDADINVERTRRMVLGHTFGDVYVTGTDDDARNLTNLALAAQLRLASGDTTTLTDFRDGNNVVHALTPMQMLGLWQQSASFVSALYASSWALKALTPIPHDYTLDKYWT